MTREEQAQLLTAHRSYRLTQLLFLAISLGSFVAATISLAWASRHLNSQQSNNILEQAVPLLLASLSLLGVTAMLLYRRLSTLENTPHAQIGSSLETQHRLQRQQHVWRHLRELHQQEIPESHFLDAVQIALKELLTVPRISIWFFDDPQGFMTCRSSLDVSQVGTRIAMGDIEAYIDTLNRAPCMESSRVGEDPRLVGLRHYLKAHGIVSMLDVGVFVGGELRGTLCCEATQPRTWQADEINSVMGASGLLSQFAESLRRREVENDLYQQIHYDAVTGLPTLRGLDDSLGLSDTNLPAFHLIALRIRGLSHVNEILGQAGGDEALRQVVTEIRRRLVPQSRMPRLARLPANQLAIILPGEAPDAWLQERLADLLLLLTEQTWHIRDQPCQLLFSAGMAHFPRDGDNFDLVLQRAELALKRARQERLPGLVDYAPKLSEWESHQLLTERELRVAIAEQQFLLYLQPQFRPDGQLQGAEILLRWQHPEQGVLTPGAFIDNAERSGLIRPIGYWVLEQAVELLRGPLADRDLMLAVNVSIQQLRDAEFLPHLEALLARRGVAPQRLVLEIVESLLATQGMASTLQALRNLGVQLSLDDFGTGYCSLRYLQEFPVNEIKLDKVFIDPLRCGADAPLARSIIALARALNLRIVAEGIESTEQLDFLRQQQVDLLQGYYMARPEPVTAFLERLGNGE